MLYYWIGKFTVSTVVLALVFCALVYIADKGPGVGTLLLCGIVAVAVGFVAAMFEETGDPWG